ncbi:hypothetical protein BTVI_18564 [Pitangus sulphuratus]|nr:hypothetical protein BTVI_18564 [Pitangus sulphuratus]
MQKDGLDMVSSSFSHHLWNLEEELKQQREGKSAFLAEALLQIAKNQCTAQSETRPLAPKEEYVWGVCLEAEAKTPGDNGRSGLWTLEKLHVRLKSASQQVMTGKVSQLSSAT